MKICLHIHSEYSFDSRSEVTAIMTEAKALGYDLIAITDHNTAAGSIRAAALGWETPGVIIAAEFSTEVGHILALDIDEALERVSKKRSPRLYDFDDLVRNIHLKGGLAILAHPYDSKIQAYPEKVALLDGVESYNSRIDTFVWKRRSAALLKEICAKGPGLLKTAGPDAHIVEELGNCYLDCPGKASESLKELLAHENTVVKAKGQNIVIARAYREHGLGRKPKKWLKWALRYWYGFWEEK